MILTACAREKEVTALVERGQWPGACPEELRAHVEGCRACGDLVLVMAAFQGARVEAAGAAPVGSAGVLWWRAQLRRRKAAVERIGKPIFGAQIFALSITLAIAVAFGVSQARNVLHWLAQIVRLPAFRLDSLWPAALAAPPWSTPLLIAGIAALALLGGVALYLAWEKH